MIRKLVCLLLLFALCAAGTAVSESTQITAGDWAFTHAPEESVLLLREDGTAVFKGQEYSWTGDGEFIRLAAEGGEEISLRFVTTEEKTLLYIPKEYVRAEGYSREGLPGVWTGKGEGKSSFIFRDDEMFLEDGTFIGTFRVDEEAGTILLAYSQYFDDTLCYFRMDGNDALTVDYPWTMVKTQAP